jgi:hypothetical protein
MLALLKSLKTRALYAKVSRDASDCMNRTTPPAGMQAAAGTKASAGTPAIAGSPAEIRRHTSSSSQQQ